MKPSFIFQSRSYSKLPKSVMVDLETVEVKENTKKLLENQFSHASDAFSCNVCCGENHIAPGLLGASMKPTYRSSHNERLFRG